MILELGSIWKDYNKIKFCYVRQERKGLEMLNNKFKEVIKNLEGNIENKKDLIFAKTQITELTMEYLDELEKMESKYKQKIAIFENRLEGLEVAMQRLDNEIFQEDEEDTDLEPIKCPYCNTNFFIEFDNTKKEIKCPDCKNIIELDWGNFEDDM